ncbi:cytoplasmic protein [Candidatus Bipolaricaulota bacterium]|nr:cytoplasmic protein [Candidatus Bipolaricaulota bacterium]
MNYNNVLLAGETWFTVERHFKGWDTFSNTSFHDGAKKFKEVLRGEGYDVDHLPGHEVPTKFPVSQDKLNEYDVVILSDIGSNSLLLTPDTWLESERSANRLSLIKEYVIDGGNLLMVGGYYSFQGIHGRARFADTPVEEVLPVSLMRTDDRREAPEGAEPRKSSSEEVLTELPGNLPHVLGYNKTKMDDGGELIYSYDEDPILAVGEYGEGRSVAWTPDIGPHWCPESFMESEDYKLLWREVMDWLSGGG